MRSRKKKSRRENKIVVTEIRRRKKGRREKKGLCECVLVWKEKEEGKNEARNWR